MADLKLGSQGAMVTMPAPKADGGCVESRVRVETRVRNADAGLVVDRWGTKKVWTITWPLLSAADIATIETQYAKDETLDFQPVDGSGPYDVTVRGYRKTPRQMANGIYYSAVMVVEEV